jgi:hypothetical protein
VVPSWFAPGWRGGGRPPGARNKITEIALATLTEHFAEHGKDAIDRVYRERPHHYLSVVASLLPRQLHVERSSPFSDLTDSELDQLEQLLAAIRARTVQTIEQQNGAQRRPGRACMHDPPSSTG